MSRSHEAYRGDAIGKLIAHDFGNGQACDGRLDRGLQYVMQAYAGGSATCDQVILLAVGLALKRGDIHIFPAFCRKLLEQCGGCRAIDIKSDLGWHQFFGEGLWRRLGQHGGQTHGQTSRGGKRHNLIARGNQSLQLQGVMQTLRKSLA